MSDLGDFRMADGVTNSRIFLLDGLSLHRLGLAKGSIMSIKYE